MNISTIVQRMRGEYIEARHSSVMYCNLITQEEGIQKKCEEGLSLRIVDKGRLKCCHTNKKEFIDQMIQETPWRPLSGYSLPTPTQYYGDRPDPLELPVEAVNAFESNTKSVKARLESLTVYEHIVTNTGSDVYHGNSKLFVRIFLTPVKGITLVHFCGYPGEDVVKSLEQLERIDMRSFSHYHSIPSGRYDVVLSPQVTGMLFHEITHLFEGSIPDIPDFSIPISLFDNPTTERLGGYTHDSEGCKGSLIPLVTKGKIQHCLASVFEPGDRTPTGHGRASSFAAEPIPRQSNLEITWESTGSCAEQELLQIIRNGVYVAQIGQGSIFPGNVMYFANTVSYRIEKGEIKEPLKNINFGGNLIDIANNIKCMGTNYTVVPSVCWKKNQRSFVTTKAPSSLVRGVSLLC